MIKKNLLRSILLSFFYIPVHVFGQGTGNDLKGTISQYNLDMNECKVSEIDVIYHLFSLAGTPEFNLNIAWQTSGADPACLKSKDIYFLIKCHTQNAGNYAGELYACAGSGGMVLNAGAGYGVDVLLGLDYNQLFVTSSSITGDPNTDLSNLENQKVQYLDATTAKTCWNGGLIVDGLYTIISKKGSGFQNNTTTIASNTSSGNNTASGSNAGQVNTTTNNSNSSAANNKAANAGNNYSTINTTNQNTNNQYNNTSAGADSKTQEFKQYDDQLQKNFQSNNSQAQDFGQTAGDFAGSVMNLSSAIQNHKEEMSNFKNRVLEREHGYTLSTFANEYNIIYVNSFRGYSDDETISVDNNFFRKHIAERIQNQKYGSAARKIASCYDHNVDDTKYSFHEEEDEIDDPTCKWMVNTRWVTRTASGFLSDFNGSFCTNAKSNKVYRDVEFSMFTDLETHGYLDFDKIQNRAAKGDLPSAYIAGVVYYQGITAYTNESKKKTYPAIPIDLDMSSKYFQSIINAADANKEYYLKLAYFYLGIIKRSKGLKEKNMDLLLESNQMFEKAYIINCKTWLTSIETLGEDHGRQDEAVFDFFQISIMKELVLNMGCLLGNNRDDMETNEWCKKAIWYYVNFPKQNDEDSYSLAPNSFNSKASGAKSSQTENNENSNDFSKDKTDSFRQAADMYRLKKEYCTSAEWYNKTIKSNPQSQPLDYFWCTVMYFYCKQYDLALTAAENYETKYPDQPSAIYWHARTLECIDSNAVTGAAAQYFVKWIEKTKFDVDKLEWRKNAVAAYEYLVVYYYNSGDKSNLNLYLDKLKTINPTDHILKQIDTSKK